MSQPHAFPQFPGNGSSLTDPRTAGLEGVPGCTSQPSGAQPCAGAFGLPVSCPPAAWKRPQRKHPRLFKAHPVGHLQCPRAKEQCACFLIGTKEHCIFHDPAIASKRITDQGHSHRAVSSEQRHKFRMSH